MIEDPRAKESVFWIPTSKIKPNQYQPRTEFDEAALKGLAESIRQYGILQPLVVTREEEVTEEGVSVFYELIAGERRFRAASLLNLPEVPVIIRRDEPARVRLELALVENVQRKGLNALERARAYKRLIDEFGINQAEIADRIGKSRESIANTLRILMLPEYITDAIAAGAITEGHTRPLLMLADHKEEQERLFNDIVAHNISVRQAELISRRVARERARKFDDLPNDKTREVEEKLQEKLGTRVVISREKGGKGKIAIEFFSEEELSGLAAKLISAERQQESEPEQEQESTFTV